MCWDIRKQIFENYLLVEDTKRTRSYPILFIFPFIHFFNTYIWQLFFFFHVPDIVIGIPALQWKKFRLLWQHMRVRSSLRKSWEDM